MKVLPKPLHVINTSDCSTRPSAKVDMGAISIFNLVEILITRKAIFVVDDNINDTRSFFGVYAADIEFDAFSGEVYCKYIVGEFDGKNYDNLDCKKLVIVDKQRKLIEQVRIYLPEEGLFCTLDLRNVFIDSYDGEDYTRKLSILMLANTLAMRWQKRLSLGGKYFNSQNSVNYVCAGTNFKRDARLQFRLNLDTDRFLINGYVSEGSVEEEAIELARTTNAQYINLNLCYLLWLLTIWGDGLQSITKGDFRRLTEGELRFVKIENERFSYVLSDVLNFT